MSAKSSPRLNVCGECLAIHCVLLFVTRNINGLCSKLALAQSRWRIESPSFPYDCTKCALYGTFYLEGNSSVSKTCIGLESHRIRGEERRREERRQAEEKKYLSLFHMFWAFLCVHLPLQPVMCKQSLWVGWLHLLSRYQFSSSLSAVIVTVRLPRKLWGFQKCSVYHNHK